MSFFCFWRGVHQISKKSNFLGLDKSIILFSLNLIIESVSKLCSLVIDFYVIPKIFQVLKELKSWMYLESIVQIVG